MGLRNYVRWYNSTLDTTRELIHPVLESMDVTHAFEGPRVPGSSIFGPRKKFKENSSVAMVWQ